MKKLTQVQQRALDKLSELSQPTTSKNLGVQIVTMQALEKAGRIKKAKQVAKKDGRECETILWQAIKHTGN